MTEGYCVKCREKVELEDEEEYTMKNGKKAIKGACPQCRTAVFVILRPKTPDYW
jgi:DNA-directed RNA polymerase subunit RPC12/RpoP